MHELHEIVKMEAAELKYDAILEKKLDENIKLSRETAEILSKKMGE